MISAGEPIFVVPTISAGTPEATECGGTSFRTTLAAIIFEPSPISILPSIVAPGPINTPLRTFG